MKYLVFTATLLAVSPVQAQVQYGPRVPVGPQAGFACPSGSVWIEPGNNVQSIVNAHAAGTSYCLLRGTYNQQSIVPKTGDKYGGEFGAILDGQGVTSQAFSGSAANVTIANFVIQNYSTGGPCTDANHAGCQRGAVDNNGSAWIIQNNEIMAANGVGVIARNGAQVIANNIHDNGQEGYSCSGTGVVFTDNEIAHNNPLGDVNPGWEAGAGKCYYSTGLVVKYNYSHDNHGPGLWTDINNIGVDYEYNRVENNWAGGIFHEISYDAVIAYNLVKNNSQLIYCPGWLWCAGIQIAASGGTAGKIIDVHDNVVVSNSATHGNGIALLQQDRGGGSQGAWIVQNVHVHNNTVDLSTGGATGAVQDVGDNAIFTSRGNSFDYDTFIGTGTNNSFAWNNSWMSLAQFQAAGQETHRPARPPPPPLTATVPSAALIVVPLPCPSGYTTLGSYCAKVNP
jgi:hypothetical protein